MDKLEKNRVFYALFSTALFLIIIWGVHILVQFGGFGEWRQFGGNRPRDLGQWWGIFTMHFLHGAPNPTPSDFKNFSHIFNNTTSFLVLNTMLFYFYREIALKVWLWILLFSGIFVWICGVHGSNHIGASAIVYGLAFFILSAGFINYKHILLLRVSMVVLFLYGSIVWGIFPIEERVSWEGHLGGAIAGVALVFLYKSEFPARPKSRWEMEEEFELLKAERDKNNPVKPNGKTPVVQIYRQFRFRGMDRGF